MDIVRVPLLNANEEEVEVVDVLVVPGAQVKAGDRIFVVESTKATVDVEAPSAGFVRTVAVEKGQRVSVQAVLCVLTATADEPIEAGEQRPSAASAVRATRKAEELARQHGIDLASLGMRGIIKETDVEAALAARGGAKPSRPAREPLVAPAGAVPLVVFGASGHARALVDLVRLAGTFFPIGAVDDGDIADVLGVPVLGASDLLAKLRADGVERAALGVGSVQRHRQRVRYWDMLIAAGFALPNLVHPRAMVEPSVAMGQGNQIFAGAVIGSAAKLGDNTIVNSGTVVSHDCEIASQVHVSPGAILAGGVRVGENTLIGMGVTIYLGVRIGRDVMIANGSHIMKDVPDGTIVRTSL